MIPALDANDTLGAQLEALVRRIAHMTEPVALRDYRAAQRFARAHQISSPRWSWLSTFHDAHRFGLQCLPERLSLDGLVVDAGANVGDFAALVRRMEPRSRVLCIEPADDARTALERRFADDPAVTVNHHALSSRDGSAILNVYENSEFSSLLELRPETTGEYDGLLGRDRIEVPTTTLDSLVSEPVRLLKIDVQGHEIAVLQGATETLAQTDAVLLEVGFVSHYEGDATFFELTSAMEEAGFALAGLGKLEPRGGRLLWTDACYARALT